jgi:hypothetical protein
LELAGAVFITVTVAGLVTTRVAQEVVPSTKHKANNKIVDFIVLKFGSTIRLKKK